jgi:hypothetical protein
MKKLLKALLVLVLIPLLWILVSLVGNQFDETLNPELQTLLEQTRKIRPTDGGEIRLGLLWDSPTWLQDARDVLEEKKEIEDIKSPRFKWANVYVCQETGDYCSKEDLIKHREKIQAGLKATEEVRKRYELLLDSQDYEDPYEKSFRLIPYMTNYLSVSRVFHLSIQEMPPEKGVQMLLKEARMLRKFLQSRTGLLPKLVDLIDMRRNITILRHLLQENPELQKKLPPNSLAPYQNLDHVQLMRLALDGEMAFIADAIDNVRESALGINLLNMAEAGNRFDEMTGRLFVPFLQPNATKNMFYQEYQSTLASKCWKEGDQADCDRLYQDPTPSGLKPFFKLTNQVGHMMKAILTPRIFYQPIKTKKLVNGINEELTLIQGPGGLI